MHVLMIDDMIEEHILLEESLDDNIYLSVCLNQKQAEEMIKRNKYDLIVIDINLGLESGYEVARDLQPDGVNVLLSSNSFSSNAPICIDHAIGISKQALAGYINKEASKYDRDDG